tara:strand:- start:875 stop:1180 length:306 start_codon:yes stop_codon:yes gene_type:complete
MRGETVSAFNKAWNVLKADYNEKTTIAGGGRPFDELLDAYAESYPYFNHPENETYKELMQYIQQIENQKMSLTDAQDDDRRFLARLAVEEGDHLHELEGGR